LERTPVDVLHDEVIGADIVNGADVWMIQSGDRASLTLEALVELLGRYFYGDVALQTGVACPINVTHPPGTNRIEDFIASKSSARGEWHTVPRFYRIW
jgi:hypothetical protein